MCEILHNHYFLTVCNEKIKGEPTDRKTSNVMWRLCLGLDFSKSVVKYRIKFKTIKFEIECLLYGIQFSSVAQSCLTLCDPMNCSMPGLPVHHQLPEFTQTHVHRVSDAIQPSHPLSSPSPPAPNPFQHQSLFQ